MGCEMRLSDLDFITELFGIDDVEIFVAELEALQVHVNRKTD